MKSHRSSRQIIHFQIQKYSNEDDKHEELWSIVKSIVWVVKNNWKLADKGIWEIRGDNMHFTFSKLLCWVAVDRAIKIYQSNKLFGVGIKNFRTESSNPRYKNKALRFNKENLEFVNKKKDELNKKNTEIKNKFKEISKIINNKTFVFNRESKENGDLYGSIKPKEITNLIKEKSKADVSPSQIILKDELNKIGVFKASVNFHSDVKANISIKIDFNFTEKSSKPTQNELKNPDTE